jgi:hypothetical protein
MLMLLSMIVDVDQQSQVIRDLAIGTGKTHTTMKMGMAMPNSYL